MGKKLLLVVAALLVAAFVLWIAGVIVTPDPEPVQVAASYRHPVLRLEVTPAAAAENLEIQIRPQRPGAGVAPPRWQEQRTAGCIVITLEEWQGEQDYLLTAVMPAHPAFTMAEPFAWAFQAPPDYAFDLVAVGDVMLGRLTAAMVPDYDVGYPLARIREVLEAGDLAFANLECPISDRGEPAAKKYVFRARPEAAAVLALGGFNLVSLANNHVLDYGPLALLDTMAALEELDIAWAGAGADVAQARQGALLTVKGVRVGVLAYTLPAPGRLYPAWAAGEGKAGTLYYRDQDKMLADLARMRAQADVVIVSMHWGYEYTHGVNAEQKKLGRLLVDNGADLVLGHHPHAPQGIEFYRGKPIVYSLGNFLFYPFSMDITDESFILKARIGLEGVEEMRLLPVLLGDSQPFVPEGAELERLQGVLGKLLDQFGTGYAVEGAELVLSMP